ncbi:MAG: hypothetical protein RLZZ67_455 [Candidatus Parcubacteria bacterium]|jgi:hypothetical protein
MKQITVLQTLLSSDEVKKRLSEEKETSDSLGLKIRSRFPDFTVSLSGWESGRIFNQRIVKFSAHISVNDLGTVVTGHFRYSYLVSFFWIFFFTSATYFMYINSGREYPLAPIITGLIGLAVIYFYTMAEPKDFSTSSNKGQIIGRLKALLDIRN